MRTLSFILLLCAMAAGALSSGCSKSRNAATPSGNSADSSAVSPTADGPAEMGIKWEVGKKYSMRMELDQTVKTEVPNQPQPVIQEVKLTQDFNITALKELDNGGRQLELTFENQTINVSLGNRSVLSFDSTQTPEQDAVNSAAPILRTMIGARIQYLTDAAGKVDKVEGVDELLNRLAATGRPQEQAMLKPMFTEDTLRRYVSFAEAMPGHAVTVGDSWPLKMDVSSSIGVLALNLKYTFKNWEQHGGRRCAHIEVKGDISRSATSGKAGGLR
jgi:hypothetical protein